jgi:hypothetical protein
MKIIKGVLVVLKARKIATNLFLLMGKTYREVEISIASAIPTKEKILMWH